MKPGGSHRAITEEPAKRLFQATGLPCSSSPAEMRSNQYGRYMSCWMSSSRVHTTFTGPSTCLAICDGTNRAVGLQPPAKAAADQMIVDDDLLRRQAGGLRRHRLNARDRLGADPDLALILADVHRAVHRLHRGVRQERKLVDRLDLGGGARHGLVGVTDVLRHRARAERRLLEFARDRLPW